MRKIIPFLMVLSLVVSGTSLAAPAIDATGAATLKKQIDDELQWRVDMAKIFGQGLVTDGKTEVTPKNGFYEAVLPHLSLLGDQQSKLDIGKITLHMAPAEAGGWLVQQVTLPPSATLYDAKKAPQATIAVGKQRITATWQPDRGLYPKVDSLLEDLTIRGIGKDAPTVKVATLKALINLKDNGNGTWSGPADFGAGGITIDMPGQNPISVSLAKVDSHNVYDRLDVTQTLKTRQAAQESLKAGLPKTEEEKRAFIAKLMTKNPVNSEGISSTLEASKFLMHDTGTPQQARRDISLNHVTLSALSPNMKQEKSKIMLKLVLDGLHVSFVAPPMSHLVPQAMNMQITLDNLPVAKIADQFFSIARKQIVSTTQKQEETKADVANAVSNLPRILQEAAASLTVYNTSLKSDALTADLQSRIDASTNAALGASGKVTVVVKGLDELVQKLQENALRSGSDPRLLGYLMGFMTVQTKGKPGKAADGASLRNYVLELKKNGDVLLNGTVASTKKAAPAQKP